MLPAEGRPPGSHARRISSSGSDTVDGANIAHVTPSACKCRATAIAVASERCKPACNAKQNTIICYISLFFTLLFFQLKRAVQQITSTSNSGTRSSRRSCCPATSITAGHASSNPTYAHELLHKLNAIYR